MSQSHVNQRVEALPLISRRHGHEDNVPLIRRQTSPRPQLVQPAAARSSTMLAATPHHVAKTVPASAFAVGPRIAYLESFSYTKTDYQAAMLQGMQSFVPRVDWQRAKGYIQQHGSHATMLKLMGCEQGAQGQGRELSENCKQLTSEKASLEDEESGIQAAKDEVDCVEERATRVEAERDNALNELNSLRQLVVVANENLARAEKGLNKIKRSYWHSISIARAQGVEWLVGSDMFQDVMVVASMNTTTQIYDDIYGKVLQHRLDFPINELDFPINELAFFEGKEIDEQGKSLTPSTDTIVRLKWELNEDGALVWPPSVLEDGVDLKGLPSFDAWVAGVLELQAEPSNTPPNSQLVVTLARVDASVPMDLTND
ncbi:hypothetical protein SLEP1_g2426 [Rubroshorea leprosula]|uniref:Uncharacterized protein n=1 Tax=Rubroshorea leprosula TaxID=152421 RepID=A0AAV5HPF2_9ROSI|nr:hypothetical protein SLEP1_g2426 [Rubroshorea leprosula]